MSSFDIINTKITLKKRAVSECMKSIDNLMCSSRYGISVQEGITKKYLEIGGYINELNALVKLVKDTEPVGPPNEPYNEWDIRN